MPSYGRWRRFKIVVPTKPQPSRAQEIAGGLQNAMDRGETIQMAKQSFLNAGYSPQEVQSATQYIRSRPLPTPTQSIQEQKTKTSTAGVLSSKKLAIIIVSIGTIIIIGALLLGLYWYKIF